MCDAGNIGTHPTVNLNLSINTISQNADIRVSTCAQNEDYRH